MRKATMILSVILATAILLVGCGNKNKIIEGQWVNQKLTDTELTFHKNNKVELKEGTEKHEGTYKLIEVNKEAENYLINMNFGKDEDDISLNVFFGGDGKYFNFDSEDGVVTYEKLD